MTDVFIVEHRHGLFFKARACWRDKVTWFSPSYTWQWFFHFQTWDIDPCGWPQVVIEPSPRFWFWGATRSWRSSGSSDFGCSLGKLKVFLRCPFEHPKTSPSIILFRSFRAEHFAGSYPENRPTGLCCLGFWKEVLQSCCKCCKYGSSVFSSYDFGPFQRK